MNLTGKGFTSLALSQQTGCQVLTEDTQTTKPAVLLSKKYIGHLMKAVKYFLQNIGATIGHQY